MKITFASITEGDKLYIVYKDLNNNLQIGEAVVTGFRNWTYTIGDRYENYGEKPQTNILYEFNNIKFSRNLEYELNNTHFTDSVSYESNYNDIFNSQYVETFIIYDEAVEYIVNELNHFIDVKNKEINKIQKEIQKYKDNLKLFNI